MVNNFNDANYVSYYQYWGF